MATAQPAGFGTTPWGRDWVKRVEPITITKPNPLLPRARGIVRGGHATVDLVDGNITVVVTVGNKQHTVSIAAPTYSAAEREEVLAHLIDVGAASTASGDLPDALHSSLVSRHLAPVPQSTVASCVCTAKVIPCIHITSAMYAVGVLVDRTPLKALTFRGVHVPSGSVGGPSGQRERWLSTTDLDPRTYFG